MQIKRENGVIRIGTNDIPYIWTQKSVKNINLHIKADGSLHISSPFSVSKSRIERFLLENEAFIINATKKAKLLQSYQTEPSFLEGSSVFLFGKEKKLIFSAQSREITETEDCLFLQKGMTKEEAKQALISYGVAKLQPMVTDFCKKYYPCFEDVTPYPTIRFHLLKATYGNCRPKQHLLTFGKRLCCYPPDFIEYIVVHELSHFRHPNHAKAFYTTVENILPDYKEREKAMCNLHISPFF